MLIQKITACPLSDSWAVGVADHLGTYQYDVHGCDALYFIYLQCAVIKPGCLRCATKTFWKIPYPVFCIFIYHKISNIMISWLKVWIWSTSKTNYIITIFFCLKLLWWTVSFHSVLTLLLTKKHEELGRWKTEKVSYTLAEKEKSLFFDTKDWHSRTSPRWINIVQALIIAIDL